MTAGEGLFANFNLIQAILMETCPWHVITEKPWEEIPIETKGRCLSRDALTYSAVEHSMLEPPVPKSPNTDCR